MLPDSIRIAGLCVALTIKHAQDDVVIIDSFDSLPFEDPQVSAVAVVCQLQFIVRCF
ncbi:unnamed protein product [Soboliphyme baturini]|uniref:Rad21_Rec8 domain-containing protein n=1 Tax=Soboliphyme baturini TaxID=241478 RepID=A0A183IA14_9BILA|nr:unnamed protein product [Soboliphyme baturini]